ncbi:MAG: SH3 domain-containing protein [Bacteroidia bacterium]|nr:SH3 domain-containing protein [Bacteroidia bacterium]
MDFKKLNSLIILGCCLSILFMVSSCGNTESEKDSPSKTEPKAANVSPNVVYPWVDKLNVRENPDTKAKVIATITSEDGLTLLGEVSKEKDLIVLRGVAYEENWVKVKMDDGKEGWVFGGTVKKKGEEKGNALITDSKFSFPYFGEFDLGEWEKTASKEDVGGDAEIAESTYKKGDQSLVIAEHNLGEYGFTNYQTLKGADGKILKERRFSYATDIQPNEIEEEVIDFSQKPAVKYMRKQKVYSPFFSLNAWPVMARGIWTKAAYKVEGQ